MSDLSSGGVGAGVVNLLRRVPGFRGYFEREERRESDALLREHLATELQRAKRSMDAAARSLADAGQIDRMPQIDQVRAKLDRVIGRIRGAMKGYSGFFDARPVSAALLEEVYNHDLTLIDQAAAFHKLVEGWAGEWAAGDGKLTEAEHELDQIERACDERSDLLKRLVEKKV
jgi:predicted aminopeptidase